MESDGAMGLRIATELTRNPWMCKLRRTDDITQGLRFKQRLFLHISACLHVVATALVQVANEI
jgi:hypothetical protein